MPKPLRNSFLFALTSGGVPVVVGFLCSAIAALGAPRVPLPPAPEVARALYHANFDEAYLAGSRSDAVTNDYGRLIASWSGYALERSGTENPFVVPGVDPRGDTNLMANAAVRFWVIPYWSSASATNGTGPGTYTRLAELAAVGNDSVLVLWSLQVAPDGNSISLLAQTDSGPVERFCAPIAWTAQSAHCISLNYGSNTVLSIDGLKLTNGLGTVSVPSGSAALVIGSSIDGTSSLEGTVDEIVSFCRPLTGAENLFYYNVYAAQSGLGPLPARENFGELTSSQGNWAVELNSPVPPDYEPSECVTNGPIYLTNTFAWLEESNATRVQFEVRGGTNGIAYAYNLYRSTNVAAPFLSTNWEWLEFVYTCSTVLLTNQKPPAAFYRIGPSKDSDGDSIPDWWEVLHGLNPNDPSDAAADPDDDGFTNLQEYNNGTNPFDDMLVAWGDNVSGQSTVPWDFGGVTAMAGGGAGGAGGHTLVLTPQGTVIAWGANNYGQTNVPTGLSNVLAIAAGGDQSVALKNDGTVVQWGINFASAPSNLTNAMAISAGYQHVLALRTSGTVVSWGGSNSPANTVPAGLNGVKAIGAGWNHNVALRTNGTLAVWGWGGQALGWNLTNVPSGLTNIAAIAVGALHSVALRSNGTVVAWGWSPSGETNVPAGLSNVVAVSAGRGYTLASQQDGTVIGWGGGLPGFPAGLGPLAKVTAGPGHALGLRAGILTPLILRSPGNQSKLAGQSATFQVSAWSRRQPAYQWQFNGTNIAGATNDTFTVANVQASSQGQYRAVVSNGAGTALSAQATLELILPPILLSPLTRQTVWVPFGKQFVLSVSAIAQGSGFTPLTYTWNNSTGPLPWALSSSNLTLGMFEPVREGLYWVVVSNGAGSVESPLWTVHVGPPPGSVLSWGATNAAKGLPPYLTNAIAVAAGCGHSLAIMEEGTVAAWGTNNDGQATVPVGLSNVLAIAAGSAHSLALKTGGTVVGWGRNNASQTNTPSNVTNAVSISAGGDQSLALLKDGTVVQWGQTNAPIPSTLTNVSAIASGTNFHLALLSNSTLIAWGANNYGQTNIPANLSNVVAIAAGGSHGLALRENGSVIAWGSNSSGETNVPVGLTNAMAVAAGDAYSVALRNDGAVVAWGDNTYGQTNGPAWTNSIKLIVKLIAAGAKHGLAVKFSPTVQYQVDVTKDLLLIYNTSSPDSITVWNYYLQHRPMIGGANVLGIGCTNGEITTLNDFTNQIAAPILSWLALNPTKRPQYVLAFLGVPTLAGGYPNVGCRLRAIASEWQPFVNYINMGETNDCMAYIDKLAYFGSNYSPGSLVISAYGAGYSETNYCVDAVLVPPTDDVDGPKTTNSLSSAGVPASAILYANGSFTTNHITQATNVAGYFSHGAHSSLGAAFSVDGTVKFYGNSGWFAMTTAESFNGRRGRFEAAGLSTFIEWYDASAFGGTNYANTPAIAVGNTDECSCYPDPATLLSLWASGKNSAISSWEAGRVSQGSGTTLVIGDPLVKR